MSPKLENIQIRFHKTTKKRLHEIVKEKNHKGITEYIATLINIDSGLNILKEYKGSLYITDEELQQFFKRKNHNNEDQKRNIHNKNQKKYVERYPLREKSRMLLNIKLKSGKIKKNNICVACHDSPTECHHPDYNNPYEFIELCKKCHTAIHYEK